MARETYTRRQARNYDERNYIGDARALVKDLGQLQKYELYEVVCTELRRSHTCLLYTSPSPRDRQKSRMPSSA